LVVRGGKGKERLHGKDVLGEGLLGESVTMRSLGEEVLLAKREKKGSYKKPEEKN